jgi:hypothetical protein
MIIKGILPRVIICIICIICINGGAEIRRSPLAALTGGNGIVSELYVPAHPRVGTPEMYD